MTRSGPPKPDITSGNSMPFTVGTSRPPQTVQLLVDGTVQQTRAPARRS
jgi:hypothetical protein